jgi:hypothetical protein
VSFDIPDPKAEPGASGDADRGLESRLRRAVGIGGIVGLPVLMIGRPALDWTKFRPTRNCDRQERDGRRAIGLRRAPRGPSISSPSIAPHPETPPAASPRIRQRGHAFGAGGSDGIPAPGG